MPPIPEGNADAEERVYVSHGPEAHQHDVSHRLPSRLK